MDCFCFFVFVDFVWLVVVGYSLSLGEMNVSVVVLSGGYWWFCLLVFFGLGYMVLVGYMDLGNWVIDIVGGV